MGNWLRKRRTIAAAGIAAAAAAAMMLSTSPSSGTTLVRAASPSARPHASSAQETQAVQASTLFALDLLRSQTGHNSLPAQSLVLCPSCVYTALAMLLPAARGTTASQMAHVLHSSALTPAALDTTLGALDTDLTKRSTTATTLNLSTALWTQACTQIQPDLLRLLSDAFDTGIHEADFTSHAEQARQAINTDVAHDTHGLIPDLLPSGSVDSATSLVLTDAMYLKATWDSPFPHALSSPAPFQIPGTGTVQTRTMRQTSALPYAETNGWQAVELPYQDSSLAMDLVLPPASDQATPAIGTSTLTLLLAALRPRRVDVSVPAFTVASHMSLRPALTALGMTDAFGPGADLRGLFTKNEQISLSDVIQAAHVSVDEQGTTAAAAAAVIGVGGPAPARPDTTVAFDRPFLFLIRDTRTGQILLLGQVADPRPATS